MTTRMGGAPQQQQRGVARGCCGTPVPCSRFLSFFTQLTGFDARPVKRPRKKTRKQQGGRRSFVSTDTASRATVVARASSGGDTRRQPANRRSRTAPRRVPGTPHRDRYAENQAVRRLFWRHNCLRLRRLEVQHSDVQAAAPQGVARAHENTAVWRHSENESSGEERFLERKKGREERGGGRAQAQTL